STERCVELASVGSGQGVQLAPGGGVDDGQHAVSSLGSAAAWTGLESTTVKSWSRVKNDAMPSAVTRMVSETPTVLSPSTPHIHGMTWKVMPSCRTVLSPGLMDWM